jgi:hypothetical protein
MNQPLPKATPDLAKAVWARQQSPSARSVARALTQFGRPVHFTTVRWRGGDWRNAKGQHPLDQARAALESALPLMTRNPTSTIDDLLRSSPEGAQLDKLSDGELLRKAARELARAVYLVAHMMLLQGAEKLWITRTAAVDRHKARKPAVTVSLLESRLLAQESRRCRGGLAVTPAHPRTQPSETRDHPPAITPYRRPQSHPTPVTNRSHVPAAWTGLPSAFMLAGGFGLVLSFVLKAFEA